MVFGESIDFLWSCKNTTSLSSLTHGHTGTVSSRARVARLEPTRISAASGRRYRDRPSTRSGAKPAAPRDFGCHPARFRVGWGRIHQREWRWSWSATTEASTEEMNRRHGEEPARQPKRTTQSRFWPFGFYLRMYCRKSRGEAEIAPNKTGRTQPHCPRRDRAKPA
jgi:hypothetical protein